MKNKTQEYLKILENLSKNIFLTKKTGTIEKFLNQSPSVNISSYFLKNLLKENEYAPMLYLYSIFEGIPSKKDSIINVTLNVYDILKLVQFNRDHKTLKKYRDNLIKTLESFQYATKGRPALIQNLVVEGEKKYQKFNFELILIHGIKDITIYYKEFDNFFGGNYKINNIINNIDNINLFKLINLYLYIKATTADSNEYQLILLKEMTNYINLSASSMRLYLQALIYMGMIARRGKTPSPIAYKINLNWVNDYIKSRKNIPN